MKKVTIYSPKGGVKEIQLESNAKVQDLFEKIKDVLFISDFRIIDGETFFEYSVLNQKLPKDISVVHITPKDSKAGSLYKELQKKLTPELKKELTKLVRKKRNKKNLNWINASLEDLKEVTKNKSNNKEEKLKKILEKKHIEILKNLR